MDILIPENLTGPAIDRLKQDYVVYQDPTLWQREGDLRALVVEARALLVRNQTPVTAALLAAAPRLQVVGRAGVGLDNVDVDAASERGIVVCYAPEENALSVAEHVFALLFALARKIVSADQSVRAGRWERLVHTGWELYGKTLGLLGLGRIGFRVALRARAFGLTVVAYDPYVSPNSFVVTESGAVLKSFQEVLTEADILSLHLPLTEATRHLLGEAALAWMKPTAVLINTARGGVVDEAALARALAAGRLAGAALDVRENEPPGDSPLHALPHVVLTPHIAAFTVEGQARVMEAVAGDVRRVLAGQAALNFANFPVAPPRSP